MMLVGLTGAGKSVTTAKLAAEALLAGMKVEIVTLDVHKAGAFEQLSSYASIMNVPLHAARYPEDLTPFVDKVAQGVQVFVDTPGVNPFLPEDMSFLSECILLTRQAPYWILPAGGDAHETLDAAEAFKNIGVTDFFQTRSDSVRRHGALLAAMGGGDLRLSGISAGPTVGSRLIKGSGTALHTLLDGDKFKETHVIKATEQKTAVEPDWLARLREAKA
jgi:flagellar biosynthesis protein FlhF